MRPAHSEGVCDLHQFARRSYRLVGHWNPHAFMLNRCVASRLPVLKLFDELLRLLRADVDGSSAHGQAHWLVWKPFNSGLLEKGQYSRLPQPDVSHAIAV